MDNAAAREADNASLLSKYSEQIGEPFEISTIRREDYKFHRGKAEGEDLLQANNQPSSRTPRGHQGPAAFMILGAGLDKVRNPEDNNFEIFEFCFTIFFFFFSVRCQIRISYQVFAFRYRWCRWRCPR